MIQKRTMIFVSDHAFISKWWWIGAIRNTRLPRYLNVKTCRITDRASITKMPADEEQQDLDLHHDRRAARSRRRAPSAPVSPMKTSAGKALNQRKPIAAPISAAPRSRGRGASRCAVSGRASACRT